MIVPSVRSSVFWLNNIGMITRFNKPAHIQRAGSQNNSTIDDTLSDYFF